MRWLALFFLLFAVVIGSASAVAKPACNDGRDNDGDGLIDYPADPGCYGNGDRDEYNAPPPPPPLGEPGPIAGQGYTRVFADEFDTFDTAVWTDHVWYEPSPPPGAISVSSGVLHLVSRRADGYPNIGITTRRDTQAATRSWRQGYFEARMKLTGGKGAFPAFWLLSTAHSFGIDCPPYTSELDVFEGQGSEPTVYYGTLHRNTASSCGVPDETRGGYHNIGLNLYDGAFHLFSAKWTAAEVCWYFDEALVECVPSFDSTDQDMFALIESKAGGWTGPPDATTADSLDVAVDWFRVWQR